MLETVETVKTTTYYYIVLNCAVGQLTVLSPFVLNIFRAGLKSWLDDALEPHLA